ncbi:MAG: (deoxy)nucleoside triphosphate pyrophosphohydrolase [Pseudomonadota bacterium]|nr:(deoxy)nucleoside triphosphate pyrophosphohydrolase [Pseudomonadota bacterium]
MTDGTLFVVAGALQARDGRWLLQRRPEGKHHAGLWEFPGGKVETAEIAVESLCRELAEELGIGVDPTDCTPLAFAESHGDDSERAIVILLYKVTCWSGEARALEGGAVDWFTTESLPLPTMPPLDQALVAQFI